MKTNRPLNYLLALAITGILVPSCETQTPIEAKELHDSTDEKVERNERAEIEQLLSSYETALNTSDALLAQRLYTSDGVFMPRQAPSAIGSESILKSYQFIFSVIQLNVEFAIDEIVVEGNLAFAVTSSTGTTLVNATNETSAEANRELFVFEKSDGQWKIARYMFNHTTPNH